VIQYIKNWTYWIKSQFHLPGKHVLEALAPGGYYIVVEKIKRTVKTQK
jgi:hypothetical protein